MPSAPRIAAFLLLGCLAAFPIPSDAAAKHPVSFASYQVAVPGGMAKGYLAYPTDVAPTTLLVVAHGCCTAMGAWSASVANGYYRMGAWAATYGVAVVGMQYSGPGHWDVAAGARDTIAATLDLQARWTITRTVIWGASMGGEVSGMAVAQRPDLYDDWVDQYGVTDLEEEFAVLGHLGVAPPAPARPTQVGSWILEETGGLPGQVPDAAWSSRSPVQLAAGMRGLGHAYLVHGVADLIVPVSQSLKMRDALVKAGVPVTLRVVTSGAYEQDGGVQGPFVPFVGAPVVPTPEGHTLGAHNTIGAAEAFVLLNELLAGGEPDAGVADTVQVVDYHACYVNYTYSRMAPCRVTKTG
jgi:fermentation-respiration switch protein FrsA (DUF1100 family)